MPAAQAGTVPARHSHSGTGCAVTSSTHAQLYRRFLERNRDFDGQFLTGVLTTGIYCLPSCPARRPRPENVRFFETPEQARGAGLRPCHRCRPDALYRGEAWAETIFEQTAERVRRDPAAFPDTAAIARTAGLSRTALNLLFHEHAHEAAGAFLRRARVAKAREALRSGATPAEAHAQSGFESASAFHQQFALQTGLTPGVYAQLGRNTQFVLRLPPGYRSREVLDFYGRDPEGVAESVMPAGFSKCVRVAGNAARIDVSFENGHAVCRTDAADVYAAHAIVLRMLGLGSEPSGFERNFGDDHLLGELIRQQSGLRVPLASDSWEALAWAVIGQQISLAAAVRLRRELIASFGLHHSSGMIAHPTAAAIAELEPAALTRLRFPAFKAGYLISAARAIESGEIRLNRHWSAIHLSRELRNIRGIGPWTIQYVLLRGVGLADCLPASDAGLARGLQQFTGARPGETEVREIMLRFAPYRSLATCHIWQSLKGRHE